MVEGGRDGGWRVDANGHWNPQGSVASPALANIYLHYCFDQWAHQWRQRHAHGQILFVRYADDIVAGFEHEADAQRFLVDLRERLERFALVLHPDKTRLVEFGRYAAERRAKRGLGKPETFNFLGFTHIRGRSRTGYFQLMRRTRRDRIRTKLRGLKVELQFRRHDPIPQTGAWLGQVLRGYFAYHAVPTNLRRLVDFRYHVLELWRQSLRRRSQKDSTTWTRMTHIAATFLPTPRVLHPCPDARFRVNHPRWEPSA
jgi:hypothetical protein